jgi:hypothetical protein
MLSRPKLQRLGTIGSRRESMPARVPQTKVALKLTPAIGGIDKAFRNQQDNIAANAVLPS